MPAVSDPPTLRTVRQAARPLTGGARDYDPLLELAAKASLVLLGGSSHGTHEFLSERAVITRRLIDELGFGAVAVEADWPDAHRVDRYVRGSPGDATADEALAGFDRFPGWIWRNTAVAGFVEWLRRRNAAGPPERAIGFHGIDLYSLRASMDAVHDFLARVDPAAAERARQRYACFDRFHDEPQYYGLATGLGVSPACEEEVLAQLLELQRQAGGWVRADPAVAEDAWAAEENARLVRNAEAYYRTLFLSRESAWNVRERHMADAVQSLAIHLGRGGGAARIVVWAHSSHLGDARATDMRSDGRLSLGQLLRQRYGTTALAVGFTTWAGTVTAAAEWGGPAAPRAVLPARPDSHEALLHRVGVERFLLRCRENAPLAQALREARPERSIGVVYPGGDERRSGWLQARLGEQFDAIVHLDETRAVEPLGPTSRWEHGQIPDTFPSGL